MLLTGVRFDGTNFLGWNCSIRLTLGAKEKVRFIDDTYTKPKGNQDEIEKWIQCDCTIRCWLLNLMTNESAEVFMYAQSSRGLCIDVCEQFGMTNGLLLYQIQWEITNSKQGNSSVIIFRIEL